MELEKRIVANGWVCIGMRIDDGDGRQLAEMKRKLQIEGALLSPLPDKEHERLRFRVSAY